MNIQFAAQLILKSFKPSTLSSVENFVLPTCIVQVRLRKPRHLGRAPSKDRDYFKKYHPTPKDTKEYKFLYDNYNLLLKSLVAGFQEEIVLKDKNPSAEEENVWNEEAYHKMCMTYINAENDRLRNLRLERIEEELQSMKNEKSDELAQASEQRIAEQQKAQDIVIRTIEESEHWLTLENMEEKITEAVDNPLNFNFAVDLKGRIVKRTALVLPNDHEDYLEKEAEAL